MNKQEYFEKAKDIWKNKVPKQGQSLFVEGELIRCIEKLRDEAQRNGNANRDIGHMIMLAYIAEILLNSEQFDKKEQNQIINTLEILADQSQVVIDDSPYDLLSDMTIDWLEANGSQSRRPNPVLKR